MRQSLGLIVMMTALLSVMLILYIRAMKARLPWWAANVKRQNAWPSRGSVYVCFCPSISGMVKVGTTQRATITKRMKEIERQMTGVPVKLHFAIDSMPFAWAVEQEAHRLLKKKRIVFPKGSRMGTEWHSRRSDEELQEIIDAVCEAAFNVRMVAIAQGAWPEGKPWANPTMVDMRKGLVKAPIFTEKNSPGLKLAS